MMMKINFIWVIGSCLYNSGVAVQCGVLLQPMVVKDICIKLLFLSNVVCCCSLWWRKISASSCCSLYIQDAGFVLRKLHLVLCLIVIRVCAVYLLCIEKEPKK